MLASPDAGVLEVTDLEELFNEDYPCAATNCGKAAEWKLIASCGHTSDVCTYHKAVEMRHFQRHTPNTYCHVEKDVRVTSLEAEPL